MKILHLASWCNVWDFPEKSKQGGLRMYFSEKPHWNFWICHLTLRNSEENNLSPLKILQNCVTHPLEIQKPRLIPHEFFLNIPGNSTSFLK